MVKIKPAKKNLTTGGRPSISSILLLMNSLPDPVVAFDAMLKVYFSNLSAQAFFRIDEKQMIGKYMVELLDNKNAVFESVESAVRKNQTIVLHDVSIKGRPVSSVIISTVEENSSYLMVIRQQQMQLAHKWHKQTMYPISQVRTPEQKLAEEIKKPLAVISDAAGLLKESALSDEDMALAVRIEYETGQILGLVDKFNLLHDSQYSHYKGVNLHEVLRHATMIAQETYGSNIEIRESFDSSLPDIRGHFDNLVQAKLNLIKNAAEAFPDKKGRISIRTFYDSAAGNHPHNNEQLPLCIEIEDDGQGITPETINNIFQPYFTTKPNSQGLGLPIASKIVDEHGGTINVNSQPGKTVFRINLPVPTDPVKK